MARRQNAKCQTKSSRLEPQWEHISHQAFILFSGKLYFRRGAMVLVSISWSRYDWFLRWKGNTLLLEISIFGKNSLVIRQKNKSQNGRYKKTKHAKFSEKRMFLTLWYVHVRVRISCKKCLFYGKFGVLVLCFLVTPVLRFVLLPHYQRIGIMDRAGGS